MVFSIALLAPALLTALAVSLGAKDGDTAPNIAMFGGTAGGIVCGIILGRSVGKTTPIRVLSSIIFVPIMSVVCIGLSCFGCMVSGFQLNLH